MNVLPSVRRLRAALVLGLLCGSALVGAERADRQLPMTIEADRSSTVDLARRVVRFEGRVVLTQGTLRMSAERMEVTDLGAGQRTARAIGLPDQQATFREKRDGLEEYIEGRAQSIDYDSREELVRLSGKAVVRRLRGSQLADEVVGETIVWNGAKEFFSVLPGSGPEGAGQRVRAVLTPPPANTPAGGSAASAPSSPAAPATPAPRR